MQVKEQQPWEILREYLAQADSQGLNDYLSALTKGGYVPEDERN